MVQRVLRELRNLSSGQPQSSLASLDDREIEILRRVSAGQTNQAIGDALQLSEKTIKNQLSLIFQKLRLENRTQAAIFALRHGLVTFEELDIWHR
ncbi:MAG: response regulator transcription factor, partial [Ardenticatenales bacterium]|nr:response regulator transcription factor [Ardenticatenales bacterium]